jgi:hypothetical protein
MEGAGFAARTSLRVGSRAGRAIDSLRKCSTISVVASGLVVLAPLLLPLPSRAATPYEAQIQGFITASLLVLITGEFAGRTPPNIYVPNTRPACKPSDYDDLRAAANDQAEFEAFYKRCRLVESYLDATHTQGTAYLPLGYCEILKTVFDRMLFEQVYSVPADAGDLIVFEYKGSQYRATRRALARAAKLQSSCREDGSLRVSAPRKWK